MARYYVNKNAQDNGDHEVHKWGFDWMPNESNRLYLGDYDNCFEAVRKARTYFVQVNSCFYCSRECHTR